MNLFKNSLRNLSMILGLICISFVVAISFTVQTQGLRFLAIIIFFLMVYLFSEQYRNMFFRHDLEKGKQVLSATGDFIGFICFLSISIFFVIFTINLFLKGVGILGLGSLIVVIFLYFLAKISLTRFIKSSTEKSEIQTRSP